MSFPHVGRRNEGEEARLTSEEEFLAPSTTHVGREEQVAQTIFLGIIGDILRLISVSIDLESEENMKALGLTNVEDMKAAWAPEVIFDPVTRKYVVYYSVGFPDRHRIYYSLVNEDLSGFTSPKLYFDPGYDIIDADIAYNKLDDQYVMIYKTESGAHHLRQATAKTLVPSGDKTTGVCQWEIDPNFDFSDNGQAVEAPSLFRPIGSKTWKLAYMNYGGGGYRMVTLDEHCKNPQDKENIQGNVKAQHGSFLTLTEREYNHLLTWEKVVNLLNEAKKLQKAVSVAALDEAIRKGEETLRQMAEEGKVSDMTFLLQNPDFTNGGEGWSGTSFTAASNGVAEHYNKTFDFYQTLSHLPYGIRDGFPADALARIQSASKQAIDLWNEYTGIKGLYVNIGYGADTPTADCSYGGWMRVGPNASYQKTGTLLHEMLHAIGVGTHATWYGPSFLRANSTRGYWLGTRTTRALRFWDNNPTKQLDGDKTHMWPYGINGAHEDTGNTEVLYIGNSVLAEALGEDGLPTTNSQFAIPAYVFEQDDNTKYYIKNESYGLGSKFLSVTSDGSLSWEEMTSNEALTNDKAAWYVTFDPVTCYYSLKNAATGRYMTYYSKGTNGIRTKDVDVPTAFEKFHFLPSPVEVATINGESRSAFWIAFVSSNTANCLTAQNNKTQLSVENLSFAQNAGAQRWLLLNSQEVSVLGESFRPALDKFNEKMVKWEALLHVPHSELTEGADAEYKASLEELASKTQGLSADELEALATDAENAARTFLSKVQATDPNQPFDITFFVKNCNQRGI